MQQLSFSPFPNLSTERLFLRKITIEDAEDIYALRSDDRVNKFIDRPKAHSVDDAKNFINQIRSRGSNNELLYWVITQKKDGKIIGTIGYYNISTEEETAEVGYELHPDFQGQGLMYEALTKVIHYGMNDLKFKMIEAFSERNNERSLVLLNRTHFKKDMTYKNTHEQNEDNLEITRYVLDSAIYAA